MNEIIEFIKKFTDKEIFLKEEIIKEGREFYLQKKHIQETKKAIDEKSIHAGLFLGELKGKEFKTSLHLLELISKHTENKIIISDKAEWLFACGRDIFTKQVENNRDVSQGEFVIVINEKDEVLGLAKKVKDKGNFIYKNIIDIGLYLRKEQDKKK